MNNPNKQTEPPQIDSPNESKSILKNYKLKWILVSFGSLFILSVVLNLFLMFFDETQTAVTPTKQAISIQSQVDDEQTSNIDSLISETHQVYKKVSDGKTTWVGIKTSPNIFSHVPENYEFWRLENGEKKLINIFQILEFYDKITWNLNEDGGVAFNISDTHYFIYDSNGTEKFRLLHKQTYPNYSGNFTFKSEGRPQYDVSLIIKGTCDAPFPYPYEESLFPKVLLKGVKLYDYSKEKEYYLSNAVEINCGTGYGDTVIDPYIETPTFDSEKIEFTLPNGQKTIISLKSANYAQVEFK